MRVRYPRQLAMLALACLGFTNLARSEELTLADVSHIHGIGFDASTPGAILLATHYGIFRAAPDGTAETVSVDASDYMGFSPDPADPGRLLASGHQGQGGNLGVIISTNGGVSWARISDGDNGPVDFHAMAISASDPEVMYGVYRGIQVSRDGGRSWEMVGPAPEKLIDLSVSPTDPDAVYAGTADGLMQSIDRGGTWTLAGPVGRPVTMVESTSDGSIYVYFAGVGLYRLSIAGDWEALMGSLGESYILHLAVDPKTPDHLVAVTDESLVLESFDGGQSFVPFGK